MLEHMILYLLYPCTPPRLHPRDDNRCGGAQKILTLYTSTRMTWALTVVVSIVQSIELLPKNFKDFVLDSSPSSSRVHQPCRTCRRRGWNFFLLVYAIFIVWMFPPPHPHCITRVIIMVVHCLHQESPRTIC